MKYSKFRLKVFNTHKIQKLGIFFIVIGILISAAGVTTRSYYNNKAKKMINELEAHIVAQYNKNQLLRDGRNEEAQKIEKREEESIKKAKEEKNIDFKTMYTIEIERLNIKSIIADNIDKATLKYAVGHYPDTAQPGQSGNCCLAGHSSIIYNEIFNGLEENIKKGDEIRIKGIVGTYIYSVTDFYVIEPTQLDVLDNTQTPTLTITTCTDQGKKRFIVKAALIKTEDVKKL